MRRRVAHGGQGDFRELLVDESPDALITMTPKGSVMYGSKGAEARLGHILDEAAPKPLKCRITPAIRSKN